ncbi:hypothetical protein SPRG_04011 [Saprolegnia parasitica CBS 223.65]|uniref:Uncharacterized protein n=1 Tax=Saprolegnia parasitica (strain CBS 223.65) TaxID=695850 RepID=A0A067CL04_SAPPC|nr:hypothetical protein SPRG_04011 [Saprolegnia parasitica CBS 223.65]KDO31394.1 hypothetical protein SPRG_04011 [Saprolegnia parasitica CBS 223.65]|eukprot:XP_012197991.1 hypothetical protein SPRG_04011 [Saprolegnia parasitica CBS 223.65]
MARKKPRCVVCEKIVRGITIWCDDCSFHFAVDKPPEVIELLSSDDDDDDDAPIGARPAKPANAKARAASTSPATPTETNAKPRASSKRQAHAAPTTNAPATARTKRPKTETKPKAAAPAQAAATTTSNRIPENASAHDDAKPVAVATPCPPSESSPPPAPADPTPASSAQPAPAAPAHVRRHIAETKPTLATKPGTPIKAAAAPPRSTAIRVSMPGQSIVPAPLLAANLPLNMLSPRLARLSTPPAMAPPALRRDPLPKLEATEKVHLHNRRAAGSGAPEVAQAHSTEYTSPKPEMATPTTPTIKPGKRKRHIRDDANDAPRPPPTSIIKHEDASCASDNMPSAPTPLPPPPSLGACHPNWTLLMQAWTILDSDGFPPGARRRGLLQARRAKRSAMPPIETTALNSTTM